MAMQHKMQILQDMAKAADTAAVMHTANNEYFAAAAAALRKRAEAAKNRQDKSKLIKEAGDADSKAAHYDKQARDAKEAAAAALAEVEETKKKIAVRQGCS